MKQVIYHDFLQKNIHCLLRGRSPKFRIHFNSCTQEILVGINAIVCKEFHKPLHKCVFQALYTKFNQMTLIRFRTCRQSNERFCAVSRPCDALVILPGPKSNSGSCCKGSSIAAQCSGSRETKQEHTFVFMEKNDFLTNLNMQSTCRKSARLLQCLLFFFSIFSLFGL